MAANSLRLCVLVPPYSSHFRLPLNHISKNVGAETRALVAGQQDAGTEGGYLVGGLCPIEPGWVRDVQGGGIYRQVKFAVVNFAWEISRAPWILCGTPRQSPQCVLLVCEKFAENPEFRVGNFAVNLKREISHAKLKCPEIPPPSLYNPCPQATGGGAAKMVLPQPPSMGQDCLLQLFLLEQW